MIKQNFSTITLQVCSRCLVHEVTSWVNEKWAELDEEVKKQINIELGAIKLKPGKCVVCENGLVSDGTAERILKILEENKISKKVNEEFERFFL